MCNVDTVMGCIMARSAHSSHLGPLIRVALSERFSPLVKFRVASVLESYSLAQSLRFLFCFQYLFIFFHHYDTYGLYEAGSRFS